MTAKATVTDKNGAVTLTATATIAVGAPGWKGDMVAQPSASVSGDVLAYKGIHRDAQGQIVEVKPDISWAALQPDSAGGPSNFSVVQIWGSSTATATSQGKTWVWNYNENNITNPPTYTPAPFPLDDVASGSTQDKAINDSSWPAGWNGVSGEHRAGRPPQ